VVIYQYDPVGNLILPAVPQQVSDPTTFVTQTVYDPVSNLITAPPGEHLGGFTYDGANNVITSTVPAVQTGANNFSNTQSSSTHSSTSSMGGMTTTTYDTDGNRIQSVTPPGSSAGTMSYQFDTQGSRTMYDALDSHNIPTHYDNNSSSGTSTSIDPLGHTTNFVYDAADNRTTQTMTDAMGHLTTSTYDTLNRQISATDANGTTIYDANGNTTSSHYDTMNSPTESTRTMYDTLDRTTTVTDPLGHTSTFQYDSMNNQIRTTDAGPLGNTTTVYDTENRTSSMTDAHGLTTSYKYDSTYNMTDTPISGGGSMMESTYDAIGRMIDPLGNLTIYGYDTTYDVTRTPGPDGFTYQYIYDVTDTITEGNLPAVQYTYDLSGTLTPQTGGSLLLQMYQYDATYDFTGPQGLGQTGAIDAMFDATFVPLPSTLPAAMMLFTVVWARRRFSRRNLSSL
jgi:YD repeat-containing protein